MNELVKNNDNKYDFPICQTLYSKLRLSKQILGTVSQELLQEQLMNNVE